ncbi:MAG: GntR family transcriptional regulator [Fimbriimonadaceae bacterium]|nr:GntR family transcriptional regulator [Fimbriimonadaceae bacterium]
MRNPQRESSGVERVIQKLRRIIDHAAVGDKLPSVRTLMRVSETSQPAVMRALELLEGEGMIERRERSGIFIAPMTGRKRRLILCGPNLFINPSPFSELLLDALTQPFRAQEGMATVRFVNVSLGPVPDDAIVGLLADEVWRGIETRAFGSIVVAGVEPRVVRRIEERFGPTVGFGTSAAYTVNMAMLEACQLGVGALVQGGSRRIALYNTPYLSIREVFRAALRAYGAVESLTPVALPVVMPPADLLLRPQNLFERGLDAAQQLLASAATDRPDAVVSMDDMFTQGLILGLEHAGVAVGRDVRIATYANAGSPVLTQWQDRLVQMQFSPQCIADTIHRAADALHDGAEPTGVWEPTESRGGVVVERTHLLSCAMLYPTAESVTIQLQK